MIDTENVSRSTSGILSFALLLINIRRAYNNMNIPLTYAILNE